MQSLSRAAAAIGVPSALMASVAALGWGTSGAVAAVTAPGPAAFDDLLALVAAGVAWAVLAWLTAGLLLCLAAEAGRTDGRLDRVARAITPLAVRRLAALLLGLGLVGAPLGVALPAQADRTVVAAAQPADPTEPPPTCRRSTGGPLTGPSPRRRRPTSLPILPRCWSPGRTGGAWSATTSSYDGATPSGTSPPAPWARRPRSPTSRRAGPAGTPPTDRRSALTPT